MACVECDITGRRVLVWGLGRLGGGVGATRWLVEQGGEVTVMDAAGERDLAQSVASLAGLPVRFRLGIEDTSLLGSTDLVVVNPAVNKRRSPFFACLARSGVPWTTELNLFMQRCPGFVVGITGTYGKSTTASMIATVLRAAAHEPKVFLGGNIGRSLLTELPGATNRRGIQPCDWVVVEMSSAQLEDLPRIDARPKAAVITNISPHHLDRHGSFDAYLKVKCGIVGCRA